MSTREEKTTPETQGQEAIQTLRRFENPIEPFSVNAMQRTLLKVVYDAAQNDSSTLGDDDYFNLYVLTEILEAVDNWFKKYPNPVKIQNELYKAGITIAQLDEFLVYADQHLQRRADYVPNKEFLMKLRACIEK